jgi:polygalacturonase
LQDSPFWTLHPYDCQNVTVRNVTILAPSSGAPNTDGIDPGEFACGALMYFVIFPTLAFNI